MEAGNNLSKERKDKIVKIIIIIIIIPKVPKPRLEFATHWEQYVLC